MKKSNIKLLLILGAAFVAIFLLSACGKTININDYITYSISGMDGYGEVETEVDIEQLIIDSAKACGVNYYGGFDYFSLSAQDMHKVDLIIDAYTQIMDGAGWNKTDHISNGDTITYRVNMSANEYLKELKLQVTGGEISVNVTDLDDVRYEDPFENLNIELRGISPTGTINASSNKFSSVKYYTDKDIVKNGDEVTIRVAGTSVNNLSEEEFIENFVEHYGAVPSRTEMSYTVEGMDEYISKVSQISADAETNMKSVLENFIPNSKCEWPMTRNYYSVEKYDIIGYYVLSAKEGSDAYYNNRIFLVYSADMHYEDRKETDDTTAYRYLEFEDGVVYSDGTVYIDTSSYEYPENTLVGTRFTSEGGISYAGYADFNLLYNDIINSCLDKYNVDTDIH